MGAGEVGKHMAVELFSLKHDVTLIDIDSKLIETFSERFEGTLVCDDGTQPRVLAEVNASEADLYLAITNNESANLIGAVVAKQMEVGRAIARVHKAIDSEWLFNYRERLEIDHLLCVEQLAALKLFKYVRNPAGLQSHDIVRSQIELREVEVSPKSALIGSSLSELDLPAGVRIATIQRKSKGREQIRFPDGSDQLEQNDKVILFGKPERLRDVTSELDPALRPDKKTRVVIMGANEYSMRLAGMISERGIGLTILEKSKQLCDRFMERIVDDDAAILNVDPTSREVLEEENVGSADLFIAASADDEDNIMACMQAGDLGGVRCIPLIHRPANAESLQNFRAKLGIHEVICPRMEAAQDLLRYVESEEHYHQIYDITKEIRVIQANVAEGAPAAEKAIKDVEWPAEGSLVCLVDEKASMVPSGEDVLRAGHVVYAVITRDSLREYVRLLTGR